MQRGRIKFSLGAPPPPPSMQRPTQHARLHHTTTERTGIFSSDPDSLVLKVSIIYYVNFSLGAIQIIRDTFFGTFLTLSTHVTFLNEFLKACRL